MFKLNHCNFFTLLSLIFLSNVSFSQEETILDYSINNNGQVLLEIEASAEKYYILFIKHDASSNNFELATSMTLGVNGKMKISEPLGSYAQEHYKIIGYPTSSPGDIDGDGIDDITEYNNIPFQNPLNHAQSIDFIDGSVAVNSLTTFKGLSVVKPHVMWSPFLNDMEYVKFVIEDIETDHPKVFFANSETHNFHKDFMLSIGIDFENKEVVRGEIVYHPTTLAANGTLGVFSFNFSVGLGEPFPIVQGTHELLAASMPFLKNNLSYFVVTAFQDQYEDIKDKFEGSRIPVLLESDVFADIDYLALNVAEGFGFFKLMTLEETPNAKDVVIYESVPNSLPRVGGIITSFIQTPLSHVNLRAIQDNVPNAFIREPLSIDSISNLIGKYIYYKVDQDKFHIREASLEEVNTWYENIRPDKNQIPALNLDYKSILPLDDISFGMSDAFGAKCTNVATMRSFGFPEGTIPDGFGIPFYYYQEFMKHNGLFAEVEAMIEDPSFINDLETRIEMLDNFRDKIKDAEMPQWMLDELQEMHDQFPSGTSIRCRSSTNNEDLPGFSGAGLYTSKTQHPHEGHIQKSIKQVYASMWNFRAFDERDFYRVDHFIASMGVLCHPNYSDERANGVGVSTDPIYQTEDTYYLNTQLGEDLVTNPEALTVPEEILLDKIALTEDDYIILRRSNLVDSDTLLMSDEHLDQMRNYLTTIHDNFQELYDAEGNPSFAMDIEYKITSENQLIVKQARPWASFWYLLGIINAQLENHRAILYPNPTTDGIYIECKCSISTIMIFDIQGQKVMTKNVESGNSKNRFSTSQLTNGIYFAIGFDENRKIILSEKFVKE